MTSKTRKRLWPASLVMAVAVIGVLAAFLMVASSPTSTQAHDGATGSTHCDDLTTLGRIAHDADPQNDHDCATGPTATPPPTITTPEPASGDGITSSSTTGGAGVKLVLTIESPGDLMAGSSIELYLEDDFQVPDDIDPSDVYFVGTGTGRVYVVDEIEIDDDDHFGGDDDWSIQVFLPDRNPGNDTGFDNWDSHVQRGS